MSDVSVWLLRGIEMGWHKAIEVSRNCLVAVEKAVSPKSNYK